MANNLQKFLDHDDCISEEKLLAYIEGKLSPLESNHVEQHLLGCELCSDALEGLRLLNPAQAREITADLNKEIDQRLSSGKGKVVQFISFYRIAAIIVLAALFGGGYLLFRNKPENNSIAINQPQVSGEQKEIPQIQAPAGTSAEPAEPAKQITQEITSPPQVQNSADLSLQKEVAANNTAAEEKQYHLNETKSTTEDSKKLNDIAFTQTDSIAVRNQMAMTNDEVAASKDMASNAIRDYSTDKTPAPASVEVKTTNQERINADAYKFESKKNKAVKADDAALFLRGKNNYDQKKYDLATNDFETVVNDTVSSYYDDAKWYLANCYMKLDKNTKARKLLQEISNSNSVHKKEAFGLLQE